MCRLANFPRSSTYQRILMVILMDFVVDSCPYSCGAWLRLQRKEATDTHGNL